MHINDQGFYKFILPLDNNLFPKLSNSVDFEDITKGRKGNHLVARSEQGIPIVRTTTKYTQAAHCFASIHHKIVDKIKSAAQNHNAAPLPELSFNNALIEIYDYNYAKMKYHSDQCLDLEAGSYIALFSCYEQPDHIPDHLLRKLKVRNKMTGKEFEFSLDNNSVILFSLATNTQFQHKIVLDPKPKQQGLESDNRWLGITFRQSKTFIQFKENLPYFPSGKLLQLADEEQKTAFYKWRGQENRSMDFTYPELNYTLSMGDLMIPKNE